jgi:hypothetical protein
LPSYYSLTRAPTFYSLLTDTASQAFLPRQVAQLEAQLAELEALLRDAAAKDEARITAAVKVLRHRSGVSLRRFASRSPRACISLALPARRLRCATIDEGRRSLPWACEWMACNAGFLWAALAHCSVWLL